MTGIGSRRLQNRLTIQELIAVPDGYGGSVVQVDSSFSIWAEVQSVNSNARNTDLVALGVQDFSEVFKVITRYRLETKNPKDYAVIFNGDEYTVLSVKNIDARDIKTEILIRRYDG